MPGNRYTPPFSKALSVLSAALVLAFSAAMAEPEIGAEVPYVRHEAEHGTVSGGTLVGPNRTIGDLAGEASGRQAVTLINTGDSVLWTATEQANSIVVRYCIPDSADGLGLDATLSVFINGTKQGTLDLTSRYSWLYGPEADPQNTPGLGSPRHIYDEARRLFSFTIHPGDAVMLRKDTGDSAAFYGIDFIELENVGPPLPCPADFINIADEGITPENFGSQIGPLIQWFEWKDGYKEKKGLYIPPGRYRMATQAYINNGIAPGFEIRGAGMWHTELYDDSGNEVDWGTPGFNLNGKSVKFSDFAITGAGRTRTGSGKPFFNSYGDGTVMTRLWIEHMTCGFWVGGAQGVTNNLLIDRCRLRNLGADGVNLCNGTKNSRVVNTTVRSTGDDGIAIWSAPEYDGPAGGISYAGCANNVVENCTVELPWRANAYAVYGGRDNTIRNCIARDTLTYAGVNLSSTFNPRPFEGTTLVENVRIERCGGPFWSGREFGGLWIMADDSDVSGLVLRNIDVIDATYSGIMLASETYNKPVRSMQLEFDNVRVLNPGTCGILVVDAMGTAGFTDSHLVNASATPVVRIKDSNGKTGTGTISLDTDATCSGFEDVVSPAAPTELSATALSETQIQLTWVDQAGNALSYQVERSPHGEGSWLPGPELSGSATSYVDDALTPSTSYDFRVRCNNAAGTSPYAALSASTPAGIGDGIPGWWRLLHFGNGLQLIPASQADADPDGDSTSNRLEFEAGTDPNSAASVFRIMSLDVTGGEVMFRFPSVFGKTYLVEKSADLRETGWSVHQDDIAGTDGEISVTDAVGAEFLRAFYRVKVK